MNSKKLVYSAFLVTVLSSIGKFLSLLRESSIASAFGASNSTDAFKVAFSVPDIFTAILGAAIAQTFIPVYSDVLKEKDEKKTRRFLNNIVSIVIIISVLLTIIGVLSSKLLIGLMAPGFDSVTKVHAINMTIVMLPGASFMILANLASSYLQTHGKFLSSSLLYYIYNLCIITGIAFFSRLGIAAAAWGTLFGLTGMLLIQLPGLIKLGYRFSPVIDLKDKNIRLIGSLVIPVFISSSFNQIYLIINRILASGLGSGNISSLDYAGKVSVIINSVFISSLATVLYPSFAKASDNMGSFTMIFAKSMRIVSLITIPLVSVLIILRTPVIQVLFERGAFTSKNTRITADTLAIIAIGIIGVGFREFLNRAFFCLKDTKTPMINGLIAISLNILFNITFVRFMGIYGLAFGTALSSIISSAMLMVRIKHRLKDIRGHLILDGFIKALLASVVMGIVVYILESIVENLFFGSTLMRLMNVVICGSAGLSVYALMLYILRVEEIRDILGYARNKLLGSARPAPGS